MKISILTIFPHMFDGIINESIIKRAQEKRLVEISVYDLRDWTRDSRRTVDDKPFGGGPGMVMKPEPIFAAVEALRRKDTKIILLTPQGERLNQKRAEYFSQHQDMLLICGHYEGIDERVRSALADYEVSIGDYVLTGGELPAMVLIDAITRLRPGVLGDERSKDRDTFTENSLDASTGSLLEYPQYTRPRVYKNMEVPEVLLSGDHQKIEFWRSEKALEKTKRKRPDLIKGRY